MGSISQEESRKRVKWGQTPQMEKGMVRRIRFTPVTTISRLLAASYGIKRKSSRNAVILTAMIKKGVETGIRCQGG